MPDASAAGKNADRPAGRDGEGRVGRNNRDNGGNNRAGRDRIDAEARERLTALRGNRQAARSAEEINRALESNKVLPVAIGRNGQLSNLDTKIDLTKIRDRDQLRDIKDQRDLARALGLRDNDSLRAFNTLNVDRLPGRFQNRLGDREIDRLVPRFGRANDLRLARQYDLYRRGDVARQLNLFGSIRGDRGWRNRIYGPVAGIYTGAAFSYWYAGPSFYPSYVWYPAWQPWVSWSWWDTVPVVYDPRPIYVQPIYTVEPAPVWNVATYADYPDFVSLPAVPAGTWVDVEPAIVEEGTDVQLLAVRFVDPGHPDEGTGPRFRVWVRNNTKSEISTAFDITVVASAEDEPTTEAPQAGVRLGTLEPEQIAAVDIRLPAEANTLVQDEEGRRVPFNKLHVIVDSHRELKDVNLENNGAVITRSDVLPVDPAAFALDYTAVAPESMVSLAGEGLGPEPGQVILVVDGQEYEPEIYGWYDLGVYFQIPADVKVQDAVEAEVLIVRGDGAATNPLALQIAPSDNVGPVIGTLPDAPEPDRD